MFFAHAHFWLLSHVAAEWLLAHLAGVLPFTDGWSSRELWVWGEHHLNHWYFWMVKLDVTEAPIPQLDKDGWWIWLLRMIGHSKMELYQYYSGSLQVRRCRLSWIQRLGRVSLLPSLGGPPAVNIIMSPLFERNFFELPTGKPVSFHKTSNDESRCRKLWQGSSQANFVEMLARRFQSWTKTCRMCLRRVETINVK